MTGQSDFRFRFWGVRGSYPVQAPEVERIGGNTPCVEVRAGKERLVLDGGTGLRNLGRQMMEEEFGRGQGKATILITHTHWDHIQGIPFLAPLSVAGNRLHFCGPRQPDRSFEQIIHDQQDGIFFPLPLAKIAAEVTFTDLLPETKPFSAGEVQISLAQLNHPGISLAYRLEYHQRAIAYVTDTAPFSGPLLGLGLEKLSEKEQDVVRQRLLDQLRTLCRGANCVIFDCFFTPEELEEKMHWGHASAEYALDHVVEDAQHFFVYHHAPERTDEQVEEIVAGLRLRYRDRSLQIHAAQEGLEVSL